MRTIKKSTLQTKIAKQFNLEFDKVHHYYIGDAYNDSKGNTLPNYMYYNSRVFKLQYFSGCFNPYLVELDKSKFGLILAKDTIKILQVVKVDNNKAYEFYNKKFGGQFTMV